MAVIDYSGNVRFENCVLSTRERNFYDDSDFYAVVWNEELQDIESIMYDTTRFGGGGSATVDASDEVVDRANHIVGKKMWRKIISEIKYNKRQPERGDPVIVYKGRQKDVEGLLFWIGETQYGFRVGIATDNERDEQGRYKNVVWNYLHNLKHQDENHWKTKFNANKVKALYEKCMNHGIYVKLSCDANRAGVYYV